MTMLTRPAPALASRPAPAPAGITVEAPVPQQKVSQAARLTSICQGMPLDEVLEKAQAWTDTGPGPAMKLVDHHRRYCFRMRDHSVFVVTRDRAGASISLVSLECPDGCRHRRQVAGDSESREARWICLACGQPWTGDAGDGEAQRTLSAAKLAELEHHLAAATLRERRRDSGQDTPDQTPDQTLERAAALAGSLWDHRTGFEVFLNTAQHLWRQRKFWHKGHQRSLDL